MRHIILKWVDMCILNLCFSKLGVNQSQIPNFFFLIGKMSLVLTMPQKGTQRYTQCIQEC